MHLFCRNLLLSINITCLQFSCPWFAAVAIVGVKLVVAEIEVEVEAGPMTADLTDQQFHSVKLLVVVTDVMVD